MRSGADQVCVFCGRPILGSDEVSGRGEAVAHSSCADRALADDAHWDRIAEQSGEPAEPSEPMGADGGRGAPRGRAGCVIMAALGPLAVAAGITLGVLL